MQIQNICIHHDDTQSVSEFRATEDRDLYVQFFSGYFVVSMRENKVKTNYLYPMHNIGLVTYN